MDKKKQTALDYFFSEIQRMQYFIGNDMLQAYKEAKEIETNQLKESYDQGEFNQGCNGIADEWYDKTYS
jgi:hypothetical protein